MKLSVWFHPDRDAEITPRYGFNICTDEGSAFDPCPASCCTNPDDYKSISGMEDLGSAIMVVVIKGLMQTPQDADIAAMFERSPTVLNIRDMMKNPENRVQFISLMLRMRDAINADEDFEEEITLVS